MKPNTQKKFSISSAPQKHPPPTKPKPQWQAYSSSPLNKLLAHLKLLNKALSIISVIGFLGGAISHFALIGISAKLDKSFEEMTATLNTRQDLEASLGLNYSWQNFDQASAQANMRQASEVRSIRESKAQQPDL